MFEFLGRWFRREPVVVPTRLSAAEAIAIARHAAAHDPLAPKISLTRIELRAGMPVWVVSSASRGQAVEVSIDDTTGHVFSVQRVSAD